MGIFCWVNLDTAIHVDVTLTHGSYLKMLVTNQIHPFRKKHNNGFEVLIRLPKYQDLNPIKILMNALKKCLIHGDSASQLTELKESVSDGLVLYTTAYLMRSRGVYASLGQVSYSGKSGTYSIFFCCLL